MQFDSTSFFVFFAVVYGLYLLLQLRQMWRWQNGLILIASYVFYGWWDWRFLSLIAISTVSDYLIGRRLGKLRETLPRNALPRKRLLWLSLGINLGLLGFFKYFNFFVDSAADLSAMLGIGLSPTTLNIILPVGISFYTFQTLSYTIDVYRGSMKPETNPINFATFVAFFPQLVAGPIERASKLLPQFGKARIITAEQVDSALWLIIWGFFKKLVIANNLALTLVDPTFARLAEASYVEIFGAVLAFTFQIYCDFSAYSDIARGIARLMGFELMVNFRLPYFSLNPRDFWNRWHISLSTWLRDYIYMPLTRSLIRKNPSRKNLINLIVPPMATMFASGLWHGAGWNFVLWGIYHGVILVIYGFIDPPNILSSLWKEKRYVQIAGRMGIMFGFILVGWLLFRISPADIPALFTTHTIGIRGLDDVLLPLIKLIAPLLIIQLWQYFSGNLLVPLKLPTALRVPFYVGLILATMLLAPHETVEFIYFQF